eukprot:3292446-Pyramimonas_sp.AAC.1
MAARWCLPSSSAICASGRAQPRAFTSFTRAGEKQSLRWVAFLQAKTNQQDACVVAVEYNNTQLHSPAGVGPE